eukprot:137872-Pleurochrysis_carterae.AAC.3
MEIAGRGKQQSSSEVSSGLRISLAAQVEGAQQKWYARAGQDARVCEMQRSIGEWRIAGGGERLLHVGDYEQVGTWSNRPNMAGQTATTSRSMTLNTASVHAASDRCTARRTNACCLKRCSSRLKRKGSKAERRSCLTDKNSVEHVRLSSQLSQETTRRRGAAARREQAVTRRPRSRAVRRQTADKAPRSKRPHLSTHELASCVDLSGRSECGGVPLGTRSATSATRARSAANGWACWCTRAVRGPAALLGERLVGSRGS